MKTIFLKIPLTDWVQGTIRQMEIADRSDNKSWGEYWLAAYKALGGKSEDSGIKECPKSAAYALWYLGRIQDTNVAYKDWSLVQIRKELGKNAAYAILALQILEGKNNKTKTFQTWSKAELWLEVQKKFHEQLRESPAESEQGAVRVVMGLISDGLMELNN